MPDDATEGVAEHSSRLQPSINLHAPVTALCVTALCDKITNTGGQSFWEHWLVRKIYIWAVLDMSGGGGGNPL